MKLKTNYMEQNEQEMKKPWTIQDAKDGDVVSYDDGWTCIFKCIHGIWYSSYCFITDDGVFYTGYERHAVDTTINGKAHLATKEQCNLLFQKMKEAGYKWNPKTKTLEKLPKFKVGDRIRTKKGAPTPLSNILITEVNECSYNGVIGSTTNVAHISFKYQDQYELMPMKEKLYQWYPIVDEGEYWLEDEIHPKVDPETLRRIYKDNMVTIVTNGEFLFNHNTSRLGWGTMAKQGGWKYMRIKID